MIKINGKKQGSNANEQMKLEKKRFEQRQKRESYQQEVKKEEMIKKAEGNKKLTAFL